MDCFDAELILKTDIGLKLQIYSASFPSFESTDIFASFHEGWKLTLCKMIQEWRLYIFKAWWLETSILRSLVSCWSDVLGAFWFFVLQFSNSCSIKRTKVSPSYFLYIVIVIGECVFSVCIVMLVLTWLRISLTKVNIIYPDLVCSISWSCV